MRWQRVAQAAIAVFVIGFIAVLVITLRRERAQPPPQEAPTRTVPDAPVETPRGGSQQVVDPTGREEWKIEFGTHVVLPDGRQQMAGGVKATINRGDGPVVITAREGEVTPAEEGSKAPLKDAVFRGDAIISGDDGLAVKGDEITYTHADGLITMPGPVTFAKGRTSGSGVNATYDEGRGVFWIREQARVKVSPAPDGTGAIDATAHAIGMARLEHYMRLEGAARIVGEGRTAEADSIVIRLTDDDQRVRGMELRGNSRISGSAGAVQAMSARDIDMTYADDGRTLQAAKLIENAVVELPGEAGKRIAGRTIDIALGPDGSTVTSLSASAPVQVDLPAEGTSAAKRIRSTSLSATGEPGEGLRRATFGGGVEYRETRPAQRTVAAVDRTARSETLVVETQPGLGAIQRADFRGNVRFTDPPDFVAQAQQGIYDIARDRLELMPAIGLPGPASPTVTDGNVAVAARRIEFSLATRDLTAETNVRSTIDPKARKGRDGATTKMPSMLADDEPVHVTSNRLAYNGAASSAVYTGKVTLWQGADTTVKGDTITIDDTTGNLTADGNATTAFIFEETDRRTKAKRREATTGTASTFTYEDAKRVATYTGNAHMRGPQGDVTGERIVLTLKPGVNELERAEAFGASGTVQVREGNRLAKGSHLTYTSADERYLLTGSPAEIIEERNGTCTLTVGASATFNRATERAEVVGSQSGHLQTRTDKLKACPAELRR